MLNDIYVSRLVQHNDGYKILKGVRSSGAHWEGEKNRLIAQIRQFGLPSVFLTLSAADIQWEELLVQLMKTVYNEIITEEAKNLSYPERAILIQKDPITCALHFDARFKALKRTWASPDGPFGSYKISHYYYRIEFQQRGSPHVHMLLWLESAPMFDVNVPQSMVDMCALADQIISCSSDDIPNHLVDVQHHNHSSTCKKKFGDGCRFNIPYYPMKETTILIPLAKDYDENNLEELKKVAKRSVKDGSESR